MVPYHRVSTLLFMLFDLAKLFREKLLKTCIYLKMVLFPADTPNAPREDIPGNTFHPTGVPSRVLFILLLFVYEGYRG